MTTLYTNGEFITLTPAQFSSYSLIRYSATQPLSPVAVGFTTSGSVDFLLKLGFVSAHIEGWTGADKIISGAGWDTLWGNAGNDSLYGYTGDDLLFGDWDDGLASGNDQLFGGDGNDVLIGGTGNDFLYGGNGDDEFQIGEDNPGYDPLFGGAGYDRVSILDTFETGLTTVSLQRFTLNAAASVEYLVVGDIDLTGTAGNDAIDLTGTMAYRNGLFGVTYFAIDLLGGTDSFLGGVSDENVTLAGGNDNVSMGAGYDRITVLDGNRSGDVLFGGEGDDVLVLGDIDYTGTAPVRTLEMTSLAFVAAGQFERLWIGGDIQLTGTAAADVVTLAGVTEIKLRQPWLLLAGNDSFTVGNGYSIWVDGGLGNDTLIGGVGSDTLIGGVGNDRMVGGEGSDTYHIDSAGDIVVETGRYGIDTLIVTARTWTLIAPFEGLTAQGKGGLIGIGNAYANELTGGAGIDSLSGLAGNDRLTGAGPDTLLGGTGNDTYVVNDSSVTIVELVGQGSDTVATEAAKWTLTGGIENLFLIGSLGQVGIGTAGANVLQAGGTGHKTLQGLGGNDTLIALQTDNRLEGGTGNDTYLVSSLGGEIVELALAGLDRAEVNLDYPFGAPWLIETAYVLPDFVEQLYLSIKPNNTGGDLYRGVTGTGNASDNLIVGCYGNDTLYGMDGNDTLVGGNGDTGNDGNDSLIGGNGNDTYQLKYFAAPGKPAVADLVIEAANGGFDTIELSSSTVDLDLFANVEAVTNRYYSGTGLVKMGSNVNGNALANVLITDIGSDVLSGGDGHDTLTGGEGNDRFFFWVGPDKTFTTESSDTITDFTHGLDKIMLRYSSFPGLPTGTMSADFKVISGGGVADDTDRLLYDQTTGQLFFDPDGGGQAAAWVVAELTNHAVLSASDILVYG